MASKEAITVSSLSPAARMGRAALLILGMSSLVTGMWGGLLRLPMAVPMPVEHANWLSFHGPLMACGFLGTLISLERAVGLRAPWTYLVPLFNGIGAATLASGILDPWPRWLLTAGSAGFIAISARILQLQTSLANVVMGLGALAWFTGNVLWIFGNEIPQVVLWWLAFLLLTIVGERIELARYQRPSPFARPWLLGALSLLAAGLTTGGIWPQASGLLVGVALLALGAWLARFDVARRTLHNSGLPRFMAVCLLSGYLWLLVAATLIGSTWPQSSGLLYDAALHAFFVGFVFSMIFGHAPVIFPAVLGLPVHYRSVAYVPLVLLHSSVLLRLLSDLVPWPAARPWGAVGNAAAVALFLLSTVASLLLPAPSRKT